MLLPVVLIFMVLLVNKPGLMKEWINTRAYNVVAWAAVALMVALTVALLGISLRDYAALGRRRAAASRDRARHGRRSA